VTSQATGHKGSGFREYAGTGVIIVDLFPTGDWGQRRSDPGNCLSPEPFYLRCLSRNFFRGKPLTNQYPYAGQQVYHRLTLMVKSDKLFTRAPVVAVRFHNLPLEDF
jgi:hypothetical protein